MVELLVVRPRVPPQRVELGRGRGRALGGVLHREDREQASTVAVGVAGVRRSRAASAPAWCIVREHAATASRAVAVAGRDGAEQVAAEGVEGRLVDRLPAGHQVAEGLGHPVDVAAPEQPALLVVAEAVEVVGEPARQREVVEAHPDRQAGVAPRLEDRAVALDLLLGVVALPRLEPVPVERQPVVGEAVLGVEREVLGVAGGEPVPVTGARRPARAPPTRTSRCPATRPRSASTRRPSPR